MRTELRLAIAASAALSLLVGLPGGASAGDGRIEISQAKAIQGGINGENLASSPQDANGQDGPGFPVTLTRSGSYVLTSNLTGLDLNTTAIVVLADNVAIDLNGFSIVGPRTAPDPTVTGTGLGIKATVSTVKRLSVANGSIVGVGSSGIGTSAGVAAEVRGVTARLCLNGVNVGASSVVEGCTAVANVASGILAPESSTVRACTANGNGQRGISALAGVLVLQCVANGNGTDGIVVTGLSVVADSVATDNEGAGIQVGNGCTVRGNTAGINDGAGLKVGDRSTVVGNVFTSNLIGVETTGTDRVGFAHNVISGNTVDIFGNGHGVGMDGANVNLITPP
ncbi:MAG: hypothetical protein L0206_04985 [Actinobacteria bacterium]|nr:hypothetical protein [Actinomycetota bacterium]